MNVTPVVDIVNDTVSTNEDTVLVFNAITGVGGGNADNFENAGRVITAVTQGANGSVTFLANGQITYTPTANWFGSDSFTYTVTSGGLTETATVNVTVVSVNDPPVAVGMIADQSDNDAETVASINVTGFFSDIDGGTLTFSDGGTLPPGLAIDTNTGIISGTLDSSASTGGPYTVVITADDGNGGTVTQTFTWNVNNPAPDAVNDGFGANEDTAGVVGNAITNNDSDPDGDILGAVVQSNVVGTNGGRFSIAANGDVSFDPNGSFEDLAAGETRTTSFTYTLVDADGATDTATVTVTVTGVNDTPITIGTIGTQTNNDSDPIVPLNVTGFFDDPDTSDVLTYTATGLPPGLGIDLNTGIISGTIGSSASVGGPYTVVVTANDGKGGTVTRSFTWNVNNPAPDAVNDGFGANEDTAGVVGNAITNNDSDPDGDILGAVVQSNVVGTNGGRFSIAANGDVSFDPNGSFEDLAAGETRTTSFTYTLVDADGATDTATVTVTVTGVNDTPITIGTIGTQTNNDSDPIIPLNVTGFFDDPDTSDVLTYTATGLPPGLGIDLNTGIISGTIGSSASVGGPYTVVTTANDGKGGTVTRSFTWNVNNPAPDAVNDGFGANEDTAGVVGNAITNNDSDPDGDILGAVVQSNVVGSNGGRFSIAANGDVSFDPNGDFEDLAAGETRTTSFTYTLVDADGATDTATVTVTVTGINDTPITIGTIGTQTNNDSDPIIPLNVTGFFDDPDTSDVLTYTATGLPPGLGIDLNTGIISGTIGSSASVGGPYTVVITANDGKGGTVTRSFTWNVNNPAPDAVDDGFGANEDTAGVVGNAITNNDSDPDGDILGAVVQSNVVGSNGGRFSIAANGDVSFDPNGSFEDLAAGETRTTSFTYTLVDADGATDTATVTVTVTGVNDTPVGVGSIADQNDNDSEAVSFNVSGFFDDPDTSDGLTYSAAGLPPGLSIDLNTGVISGTLDSSASVGGPYSVQITANDGNGGTLTRTFVWNVANPAPAAVNDDYAVLQNDAAAVVGNALANDSDPDGDSVAAVAQSGVAGSNGGVFSIDANGDVTFDPAGAFADLLGGQSRETSFTYTLVDVDGATRTATVTVTVSAVNAPPKANSGAVTVNVGSTGGKIGLKAPTDPDGNQLTIRVTSLPRVGTLKLPNGTPIEVGQFLSSSQLEKLVYDAPAEYRSKKPVYFRYQVSDGQYVKSALVTIHIKRTPAAPYNCFTALFGTNPVDQKLAGSKVAHKLYSPAAKVHSLPSLKIAAGKIGTPDR